jgi:hypothetical protein
MCERRLTASLADENCLEVLQLAAQHGGGARLNHAALAYIMQNRRRLVRTQTWVERMGCLPASLLADVERLLV